MKQKQSSVTNMTETDGVSKYQQTQYLKAILNVEAMFEGAMVEFLLLGETARRMKYAESLEGLELLEFGVQDRKLNRYARSTFKVLHGENWQEKEYAGIPVKITVIKKRWKFFEHPDTFLYWGGAFKVANPWDSYWKKRGIIH